MAIGSCMDFRPCEGTYVYLGQIYASKKGFVRVSDEDVQSISVVTSLKDLDNSAAKMDESADGGLSLEDLIPREGDLVYGRVNKVEDRFARIKILSLGDTPLNGNTHFTGVIFKEQVRDYDRDSIVMAKCFVPNDIVKARVI